MNGKAVDILTSTLDELPREECGVFGITGAENAAELSFLGL
jgi:hypothetical protein